MLLKLPVVVDGAYLNSTNFINGEFNHPNKGKRLEGRM
jgi:hypothetical protein